MIEKTKIIVKRGGKWEKSLPSLRVLENNRLFSACVFVTSDVSFENIQGLLALISHFGHSVHVVSWFLEI